MGALFDQAWVRRKGKVWVRHGQLPLCEVCAARQDCSARADTPTQCASFVPVLSFKDESGLEGEFNTFRRGRGWANRLLLGQVVGLFALTSGRIIGRAVVDGLHVSALGDLLDRLAASNHLMKGSEAASAVERLHRVLRALYGVNHAAFDAVFTVVEVRRVE